MKYYNMQIEQTLSTLQASSSGLTTEKAKENHAAYGYNELHETKKKSISSMILEQFKDFLVIILLISAAISLLLGEAKSAITIFVVLTINAILGVVQQVKAEKSLASLKQLSTPNAKVLRDGHKVVIPSREVVVGDIVVLDAGDHVPADGRIVESYSLQIVESALTGESTSVDKSTVPLNKEEDVPVGDQENMVFSGSLVTYGRGSFVVTAIGMNTEIGRIATLLESAEQKDTPLQVKLDEFGKRLGIIIIVISILIFALNVFRGQSYFGAFMFAVALAVAAIPEALASIVSIVLAVGTQRMAKKHAIIRKLPAVETLGAASVICSDKTGTLTLNKMAVTQVYYSETSQKISDANYISQNPTELQLLHMSILCNDAIIKEDKTEIGDPTEIALVMWAQKAGISITDLRKEYPRLSEIAFDSERKLMSTVHKKDDNILLVTKGAPDVMFTKCVNMEVNGQTVPFDIQKAAQINEEFGKQALRVLAVGYKEIQDPHTITVDDEKDYTFVGLVGMIDPPRPEAKLAVEKSISAGILPVMITGDHKITASAIAAELGLLRNNLSAMEGKEIDTLTDEQLIEKLPDIAVFARVSPEHKIRIVKGWQARNQVVSMTGDGVNDAPALKQADIGVAMGITGTDVAKDASDMILTDDNFATIVDAVEEGRTIYNNIKKSIQFLLSGNTAGLLSVIYAAFAGLPNPFLPIHLLWINLITDSLPAIALGMEKPETNVMMEHPRNAKESIFSNGMGKRVVIEGSIIAISTIIAFYIGLQSDKIKYAQQLSIGTAPTAMTMAFSTLTLARLVHGFNVRSNRSNFKIGWFTNLYIIGALLIGVALQSLILFVPVFRSVFDVAVLTPQQIGWIFFLSILPLLIVEIKKIFFGK